MDSKFNNNKSRSNKQNTEIYNFESRAVKTSIFIAMRVAIT